MGQKVLVKYWPSRQAYYGPVDSKHYKLAVGPDDAPSGPTYQEAVKEWLRLLAGERAPTAGDGNTVGTICELFMERTDAKVAASTRINRRLVLGPFIAHLGQVPISLLTPFQVDGFVAEMRKPRQRVTPTKGVQWDTWSDSTIGHRPKQADSGPELG